MSQSWALKPREGLIKDHGSYIFISKETNCVSVFSNGPLNADTENRCRIKHSPVETKECIPDKWKLVTQRIAYI